MRRSIREDVASDLPPRGTDFAPVAVPSTRSPALMKIRIEFCLQ